jgi:hypothetical protein
MIGVILKQVFEHIAVDESETAEATKLSPKPTTALDTVIKEAQPDNIINRFQIKSNAGKEAFMAGLKRFSPSSQLLKERSARFASFRALLVKEPILASQLNNFLTSWQKSETTIETILKPPSEESSESIGQIIFTSPWFSPLNSVPFLITILLFLKIYITPLMSFMLPFAMIVLPYFIMRFLFNTPITVDQYWEMFKKLVLGNIFTPSENIGGTIHKVFQVGGFLFSLGQTMIQPYLTARHVAKIDSIYETEMGTLRQAMDQWLDLTTALRARGFHINDRSLRFWLRSVGSGHRELLGAIHDNKTLVKMWIRSIGDLEVLAAFAQAPASHVCATATSAAGPFLEVQGAYDPQVSPEKRKLINLTLGWQNEKKHAILTGPNRGGKSTALRSLLVNTLLAQTYGIGLGSSVKIFPFNWIHSCLRLEDIPGSTSFFEREVEMAAMSLRRGELQKPGLVLVDELFHSTNPPDSHKAACIYTSQIHANPYLVSVISTHDFSLVEKMPTGVRRLCVSAEEDDYGKVIYKYGVEEGICRVSSVQDILLEKGLVRGR